jgi:alpha-D-xyloside xylohydrolase
MKIEYYKKLEDGLLIKTSTGMLKLIPIDKNIIRVLYTLNTEFSAKKSIMVLPQEHFDCKWDVYQVNDELHLSTEAIKVVVNMETCSFQYLDSNGNLLTREPRRGGKTLEQIEVFKSIFDEETEITSGNCVDGMRSYADNVKQIVAYKAYHSKLEFEWEESEALYGLGSHEEGMMNLRGQHQYLYQQNMKAVIPMVISTKGYAILMDSYSLMKFHDDAFGSYIWSDVVDEMDYYYIYGPEFDNIVKSYRKLTGKAPMLPRWAFGYAQSKERYKTAEELISVVKEYRNRKIPLDLIVLDWQSWSNDLWGQKSFDKERFPNPASMMNQIHLMNARLMISIWPIMRNDGSNHTEMKEKAYLLGNLATYDAFNEDARTLYWKQANEGLFSKGIDAWWCDCTEPFEADWGGSVKAEPEERMYMNTKESKKYMDPKYINAFSLLHSKGLYEGQRRTTNDKRVVNLTRSVYAGQQRYSTITWSGDVSANWETLRRQIPDGLNFCAAGIPYWSSDIGGFFVKKEPNLWFYNGDYEDGCNDLGYRELYVRWFQYATFLPIFRSHGTDTPRELWRFGEPGTIFYDTLLTFNNLRYRLLPYIYSLAGKVTHGDYTIMRLLAFDFRNDVNTYNIDNQYMFGSAFLVNPVTKPMYYDSKSVQLSGINKTRSVYLPEGCDWYDFWTGEMLAGGQTVDASATIDVIPLYVRAGTILPMGPFVQHSGEKLSEPIELRIYRGANGLFDLYEDEGDNYNYEQGRYSTINIRWNDNKGLLSLEERQGAFHGMIEKRQFKVILVDKKHGINIEQTDKIDLLIEYAGHKITVAVEAE